MLFNPEVLASLVHEMPDRSGITLRDLAQAAGKEYKTLSREMHPDDAGGKLGLDTFTYLVDRSRDFTALDYIETALGRVAFELPPVGPGCGDLHHSLADAAKECGEVVSQLCSDLADGRLDQPAEAIREIAEAARALAVLRAAVLRIAEGKDLNRPRAIAGGRGR